MGSMEAMRMAALMRYKLSLFVLSIVVAHILATAALYVRFAFKQSASSRWPRPLGAAIMGCAVAGMHYTAMSAARFYPSDLAETPAMILSPLWMAFSICGSVALILGLTFVGTMVDERLAGAAETIRETATRHSTVVETMADGLVVFDDDGVIGVVNPSTSRMFGYSVDEMVGENVGTLLPDSFGREHSGVLECYKITNEPREIRGRCKDGSTFPAELMVSKMQVGERLLFNGVLRDISERKALAAQLHQAQKLESIGHLAAGIAHEINTPTQFVSENTVFLKRAFTGLMEAMNRGRSLLEEAQEGAVSLETTEQATKAFKKAKIDYLAKQVPRALEQSLEGLERVAKLVGAMKEFSHPSQGQKEAVDLAHTIDTTLTVARSEWKYIAEVATDFDSSLPPVPCLRDEFNQVMLNMVVNAAQAIAAANGNHNNQKGTITIQTRLAGEWAEIRVSDTGTGIPLEIQQKIFDPFFTTKEVGKGTGQGLAIARSVVVDKHGGQIDVESEVGKGTTFVIQLPLEEKAVSLKLEEA